MNIISWYYGEGLLQIAKIAGYAIIWTAETFSLAELLRTLFLPWRRDVVTKRHPTLRQIFEILALNLVSRFFGFAIRFFTLIAGVVACLIVLLMAVAIFIILAAIPVSLPLLIIGALLLISNHPFSLWGWALLGLAAISVALAGWIFKKEYLENPPLPDTLRNALARLHREEAVNLAPFLSFEARQIFSHSRGIAELRQKLLASAKARFIFIRASLNPMAFPQKSPIAKISAEKFLLKAGEEAVAEKHSRIETGDLILALAYFDPSFQRALKKADLDFDDLRDIVYWQTHLWKIIYPPSALTSPHRFKTTGGIAKNWAAGYTPRLDEISHDLTDEVLNPQLDHIYQVHRKNISQLETILARRGKHNCLILGPPGVGKRQTVMGLAREILIGKTLRPLAHKRVVELDINLLLSSASSAQILENRLVAVFSEAVLAGNVILYLDGVERLLTASQNKIGSIDISAIILPYLASPRLQLIASSTYPAYQRFIKNQPGLKQAFEKIEISEPTPPQTIRILEEIAPQIEDRQQVIFSYLALKEIVGAAERLFPSRRFPQKAIDLSAELASFSSSHKIKFITPQMVDQYLSQKSKIPVGKTSQAHKDLLLNLEKILHQSIINQEQAVNQVASALRRAQSGVGRKNKPLGNFLFVGPTGVGKTALAKALASSFFGSEKAMIRLDMSEFQQPQDINRLIGDQTAKIPGILTSQIRQKPYTLVLLDEFEKACPAILNLFLQILDEGEIRDDFGEKAIFRNALIIATSNVGSNFIQNQIKKGLAADKLQTSLLEYIHNQKILSPELLNRFDGIVAFRTLTQAELVEVVEILLKRLNSRLGNKLTVQLTSAAREKLAQIGKSPEYGARALERAMQNKLENLIADKILRNQISRGQTLVVNEKMIE